VETEGQELGTWRGSSGLGRAINRSFITSYWLIGLVGVFFGLVIGCSPCFSQTVPAEGPVAEATPAGEDMFSRVIANQKRVDADLNVYERVERVEIRKTGSDPKPSEVKVWRVFPAGTGTSKIPLTAETKPTSAESYRVALEKLQTTLVWAAETGPAQREAYAKVERRKKRAERPDRHDAKGISVLEGW